MHPNTIRSWLRELDKDLEGHRRIGEAPWNKLHESARWLVHEIRRLCPEPEFGTRPIARHIIRGGVQISRSSVRRILQEEVVRPKRPWRRPMGKAPKHVQHPTEANQVWHLDMTELRVRWMKVEVAAVLDGFTRKIVALKAFGGGPSSLGLAKLVNQAISGGGACPRFLITDHGSQVWETFRAAIEELGITHVR